MRADTPGFGLEQFAHALRVDMDKRELPLKAFAAKAKITYEHARKLVRGEAFPSAALLNRISDVLAIDQTRRKVYSVSIALDKIERKYSDVFPFLLELDPKTADFARDLAPDWQELSQDQRHFFREQIHLAAEANRRRLPGAKERRS